VAGRGPGYTLNQLGEIEVRFTAEQHIQLLRCGPPRWVTPRLERTRVGRPAIRWSVASPGGEGTDQGSVVIFPERPWLRTGCQAEVPASGWCIRLSSSIGCVFGCALGDRRPHLLAGDGGDEETRTPDPLLAKEMLCQLSYVPSPRMVGVSGLEPETSALSGQCSNQLS
jgi:hypothetical protein